jgi:shikimate dehydrogenase
MQNYTQIFGLIGDNLKNTFSKDYFNHKFEANNLPFSYQNFELKNINELLPLIIQNEKIFGLNVTIPFKQSIIPFLDELDNTALEVGAVNCVKINRVNDKISFKGYNTDVLGFKQSLLNFIPINFNGKVIILGTGGVSKAVQFIFRQLAIEFITVSSQLSKISEGTIGYNELQEMDINKFTLVINATPLGMFPNVLEFPLFPYEKLTPNHFCYDLIYLPTESQFLTKSKVMQANIKNGREMLYSQADYAFSIFTKHLI